MGVAEETLSPAWMHEDSAKTAKTLGLTYYDTLEPLLDPAAVDAIIVCSEPARHAALAARALKAGLHVLVDKPIGTSSEDIAALAAAEAAAGKSLSVINRLHSPAVQRLRRWIDAGNMGLPLHVDVEWFASGAHFATSVERPELVVAPALSGGGEILNFLLYPVDYIRFLTGLEIVEVHCEASTLFSELHRDNAVEDTAIASLLLENGVTATVTLGRLPAAGGGAEFHRDPPAHAQPMGAGRSRRPPSLLRSGRRGGKPTLQTHSVSKGTTMSEVRYGLVGAGYFGLAIGRALLKEPSSNADRHGGHQSATRSWV